ncbi:hypothetical protein QBC32DRAFT_360206 [Pseudoneurospora amorphoporcata]|uniref:Uncharacterized protein n=1 Tax=Pseudoneurospora amorphoporcata TaxID=241081 RepID=A0AAN6NYR0_9PEZI|nr:hypothetical protein QBC32DRAFT_360206 [Pseudoneurospora amorphoporcata]
MGGNVTLPSPYFRTFQLDRFLSSRYRYCCLRGSATTVRAPHNLSSVHKSFLGFPVVFLSENFFSHTTTLSPQQQLHSSHRNNRNRHRNRERRRRRNLRRAENRAAVENRAPFPGVHDAGHRADLGPMDLGNRAPVVADMRHDEGWGYGGFENRALAPAEAPPASQDDQVAAYYDYYIRTEGQADIIRPLIALAVRQMGPSCLFSVSAFPMQAANGPAWVDDHHINSYGDHALARMTVALAVFQWGLRAQIRMTARRSLPAAAPPPPQQQMPYPAYAPPDTPGAAPYGEAGPHQYGYPAFEPPPAGPYDHAPYQQ